MKQNIDHDYRGARVHVDLYKFIEGVTYFLVQSCNILCVSKKGTPTLSIVTLKGINGF